MKIPIPKELNPNNDKNLMDAYQHSLKRYPEAVISSCGTQRLNFKAIDRLSTHLAAYFQHVAKLKVGDRVAIQLPNINQYILTKWALIRSGLVIVNTNPQYTERELLYQFKDAQVKAIIGLSESSAATIKVCKTLNITQQIYTNLQEIPTEFDTATPASAAKPEVGIGFNQALALGSQHTASTPDLNLDTICVLQYTGGTTGVPKGAILTHGSLMACAAQLKKNMHDSMHEGQETMVVPLPLYHIFGFIGVMTSILNAWDAVLVSNPRNLDELIKAMQQQPFSMFIGINSLYAALLQHPKIDTVDFSATKRCVTGGSALTRDVSKRWQETTGCKMYEGYGLSESSGVVTGNTDKNYRLGTVGLPIPYTEAKIVDDNNKTPQKGDPGELLVRGPQITEGYWQKPEATKKVIDSQAWFRTGDMAIIEDDGMIRIVDRKKDMIIVSGFNVYPNEIEDVVSMHPQILESAAVGVDDEKTGEAIKLFLVGSEPVPSTAEITDFCRKELTAYKVPKHIEYVASLPKSNVGKILRRLLRD